MIRKPTDRELAALLREITGRMPAMPFNDRAVRITKCTYKGADRFQLDWRDPDGGRRKVWYPNWRHAMAASRYVNKQLEEAKGKSGFTFGDAADGWIKQEELRTKAKDPALGPEVFRNYRRYAEMANVLLPV
jgi:hypothetical protein